MAQHLYYMYWLLMRSTTPLILVLQLLVLMASLAHSYLSVFVDNIVKCERRAITAEWRLRLAALPLFAWFRPTFFLFCFCLFVDHCFPLLVILFFFCAILETSKSRLGSGV